MLRSYHFSVSSETTLKSLLTLDFLEDINIALAEAGKVVNCTYSSAGHSDGILREPLLSTEANEDHKLN